ncbi:2-C-methyl-D-erythritol 4-phosphate cytidylyltransferase [Glaciecola siphonariae]|uniref:2-C-methyl-D-erythritol 4-phosphate cytidylyltransferase n=1 Tax=Glaciecola siphonariae TaxID=521012 RepID=A0ABV9LYP6_9ALTE
MTSPPSLSVVIPAAGIGTRMQSELPKQYLRVAGKTILEHTLTHFLAHRWIDTVVVALHPDDRYFETLDIANSAKIHRIDGGKERADSVLNALKYIGSLRKHHNSDWVLVHDAARPGLSAQALARLLARAGHGDGAILALEVVDTVKKIAGNGPFENTKSIIGETLNRSALMQAQTPQMFHRASLEHALEDAINKGISITDEASAMEHAGKNVCLVAGESRNLKITRPEDLALAEFYLTQPLSATEAL